MNTIENNKLIAEFMGFRFKGNNINPYNETTLKYHSDWNWLMEVAEKIKGMGYFIDMPYLSNHGYIHNSIAFNYATYSTVVCQVSSIPNPSRSNPPTAQNPAEISEFTDPKEAMYNLVIRFIKWYNKEQ